MAEQIAPSIDICYEEFGDPSNPALLLIMGFGAQMTTWDVAFCQELVGHGFRVIRFDNRDVGLSRKTLGAPPAMEMTGDWTSTARLFTLTGEPPYRLADMAADAIGLLDHLDIQKAHVVGLSLGGAITQRIAINHPDRVHSITSISSSPSNPDRGLAKPEVLQALLSRPPTTDRDAVIENNVAVARRLSGPGFDEAEARASAAASYDRSYYPAGSAFQMAANLADGNRTEELADVKIKALVIHGAADDLISVDGGEATAEAIPGATLKVYEQMGHEIPPELYGEIADLIAAHAHGAQS